MATSDFDDINEATLNELEGDALLSFLNTSPFLDTLRLPKPLTNRQLVVDRLMSMGSTSERAREIVDEMVESGVLHEPDEINAQQIKSREQTLREVGGFIGGSIQAPFHYSNPEE